MRQIILSLCLFFIFGACNDNRNEKYNFQNTELIFFGIQKNNQSTDSASNVIACLNASNDTLALSLASCDSVFEVFKYNGYVGFMPKLHDKPKQYSWYISYRLSEYFNNLDKERLLLILSNPNFEDDNEPVGGLLKRIEYNYLSFYLALKERQQFVDSLCKMSNRYPASLRIKYLLANCYYKLEKFDSAVFILRELIDKDYYKYNCLRTMIAIYNLRDLDSSRYYINYLQKQYPDKCIINLLPVNKELSIDTIEIECNKCFISHNQQDSMKARLFLTNTYLERCEFNKVDVLYRTYAKTNDEFILDSFKIWEIGEYYDIMLRKYFIQEKYTDFIFFIIKKVGYNTRIIVNNEQDLYNLVKRYYDLYYNVSDKEKFDIFFRKHFLSIKHRLLSGTIRNQT